MIEVQTHLTIGISELTHGYLLFITERNGVHSQTYAEDRIAILKAIEPYLLKLREDKH